MRVETAYGVVEGERVDAPDGTPVARFLGVPYAASTAGDRRFLRDEFGRKRKSELADIHPQVMLPA